MAAVTAVGRDRPGIVAGFSGALARLGCNLEDATMTRLRQEFAMLLLVRLPAGLDVSGLREALTATAEQLRLSLVVRALDPAEAAPPAGGNHCFILRLYGADRVGIVRDVTQLLADRSLNITDLNTRVIPGGEGPVYVMLLELEAPSEAAAEALRPELEALSRNLQVEISLDELDSEAL
jgi:glycine cleavage system transcriptional repressor